MMMGFHFMNEDNKRDVRCNLNDSVTWTAGGRLLQPASSIAIANFLIFNIQHQSLLSSPLSFNFHPPPFLPILTFSSLPFLYYSAILILQLQFISSLSSLYSFVLFCVLNLARMLSKSESNVLSD